MVLSYIGSLPFMFLLFLDYVFLYGIPFIILAFFVTWGIRKIVYKDTVKSEKPWSKPERKVVLILFLLAFLIFVFLGIAIPSNNYF